MRNSVANLVMGDLVSCLCVTRNRVDLLRRAVQCFRRQSYAPRELVIVYESDDPATRAYVLQLNDPNIIGIEVAATPRLSLGALRNLSVRVAHGKFIAQWDDDDWHAPERLALQMQALAENPLPACVLMRWFMYDEQTQTAWLSHERTWEGSLVARRDILPPYEDAPKNEDTPMIIRLLEQGLLFGMNRPDLYVYVYHGSNTWERNHWDENVMPQAQRLGEADTLTIRKLLHDPAQPS